VQKASPFLKMALSIILTGFGRGRQGTTLASRGVYAAASKRLFAHSYEPLPGLKDAAHPLHVLRVLTVVIPAIGAPVAL